jgi:uncharacterized protein YqkB
MLEQMKVRDLIARLQAAVDADAAVADYLVDADGCGCTGAARDVCVMRERTRVLVSRE